MNNITRIRKHARLLAAAGMALLLAGLVFFFAAVRGDGEKKPVRVIYIPKIIDEKNTFWVQLLQGARMAADEYNMEITIVAPDTEEDYERQNELILWAIEEAPDAILLSPSSYTENTSAIERVVEAGIPLVFVDSEVAGDYADFLVTTDNVAAGRLQGEYIGRLADESSRIVVISHVQGSSTAREREEGLRLGLGEHEDQIAEVVFCDSDYDKAYSLMNELLDRYPDIDFVAGLNEYSAVGAARAIVDRGLQEDIGLVGFDNSMEQIQLLEEGVFEAIVIQNPFKMGYLGVEAVAELLGGDRPEKRVYSDSKLITKEEVFSEENQKLLFMFEE